MKLGTGLYPDQPAPVLLRTAQLADRLGYHTLWLPDSQLLWREMAVLFGAFATGTRRIRLASAVTNPLTRHLSVIAGMFRTLDELSGNRCILGIGIGDSALQTLGMKPATLDRLAHSIAELHRLFASQRGDAGGIGYGEARPVPVYIAASSPRMLDLAGQIADGVILMNGVAPELIAAAVDRVHAGARRASRDPAAVKIVVWAACHASADQPAASREAVKFNIARTILRSLPGPIDELTRSTAAAVRQRYDYAQHGNARAGFAALIPDALVPRFAFAGTPQQVQQQIAALLPLGVGEVALAIPSDAGAGPRDAVLQALAPLLPRVDLPGEFARGICQRGFTRADLTRPKPASDA